MEVNLQEIVQLNINTIRLFGYFPPKSQSKITQTVYSVYSTIVVGFWFAAMTLSESINMIFVFGDIEQMTSASFLFLTHIIQIIKIFYLKKYRDRIQALLDRLDEDVFKPKTDQQLRILQDDIATSKMITKVFIWMVIGTCGLWGVFPYLDHKGRQLPLSGWYPFDTSVSPIFEIVYVYQTLGSMLNGLANISIDTFISGNIMIISGQFSLLNDTLVNMRELAKRRTANGKPVEEIMHEILIECVNHHRQILLYAEEFTTLFTNCVMGQFVIGVIIICLTMFQMSLVSVLSLQFCSMTLYQACILLEAFLHCYYGNEVIIKSNELTKSAYETQWLECSMDFKRDLVFLMTRSQKPLRLYAGSFFTLSLPTFVAILRTSWSYFAVLNRVHDG